MPMYTHSHSPFGPSMGMQMPMPMPMHPAMNSMIGIPPHDPMGLMSMNMGMNMVPSMGVPYHGLAGLSPTQLGGGLHPSMFEPHRRRKHYDDLYSGLGRGSSRYLDSYDLFNEIFDDGGMYADDYDDIDDPLMLWMRMARGGCGRRGGRRGRYERYGGRLGCYDR